MNITALDHLVLTVADIKRSITFYTRVLGMQEVTFGESRTALLSGCQKINLHLKGTEIQPHAAQAICGSADLYLLTDTPLPQVLAELQRHGIKTLSDIVPRTGAIDSV